MGCRAAAGWVWTFKERQCTAEVIRGAVRCYLMFPISDRDLELMLLDRGMQAGHLTSRNLIGP